MNKERTLTKQPKNKGTDDSAEGFIPEQLHVFYVSRQRKRGFVSIKGCVDITFWGLEEYRKKSKERLIIIVTAIST